MRKINKKILYPLILLFFFAACYKDGPVISLRSKTNRLLREWQVENVKVDGVDSTQRYNDSCGCTLEFASNYDYSWVDVVFLNNCKYFPNNDPCEDGNWAFENNKKILRVWFPIGNYKGLGPIGTGDSKKSDWEILKLTKNRFWFKTTFNNKEYMFKLKAK